MAMRQFLGFDSHKKAIDLLRPGDIAMCTTRSYIRPVHVEYAVSKGIHVFMEKPCCVDAPGFRTLLAANQQAREKKLSVVVGLQRRHQRNYLEGIGKIHEGAIGDVHLVRTYFNMPGGGRAGAERAVVDERR